MARIETTETSVKLVERREADGYWVVRWDFKPKLDSEGNETGVYWYEEEAYNWIPTIEDIQRTIVEWFNKQTDGMIQHGYRWKGIQVLLNDENKFNYKAIRDEVYDREEDIKKWDEEHPELASINAILKEGVDQDGNPVQIPIYTGRPQSLLPITLKLGESNAPENFYVFNTLEELKEFFSAGVEHLLGAYEAGWYNIATYDWSPYVKALEEL